MFKQQKMLMYAMPLIFLFSGVMFPLGVMVYWTASNLWALGQQTYTLRKHPAPGSEAYKEKQKRDAEKRAKKGLPPVSDDTAATTEVEPPAGQRVQPMRKDRAKKKATDPLAPLAGATPEADQPYAEPEVAADGELRGKDGLTEAERARKRYEARAAERKAAREKRLAAEKRRREGQNKPKYNADGS